MSVACLQCFASKGRLACSPFQVRYASLQKAFPEEAKNLNARLEKEFAERYEDLKLMADPMSICKEEESE
jgi:hypothetical protein